MAPIEQVLPAEGQEPVREVDNTRTERAQEEPTAAQEGAQETTDGAQNQVDETG